jgi:hypothetical protein
MPLINQFGSSLVELLAAMAAGLVVLGAALQSFSYFHQQFLMQRDTILQAQDVRLSLELLAQELHLASTGSLSVARPDAVEFTANISGIMTKVCWDKRLCPSRMVVAGRTTRSWESAGTNAAIHSRSPAQGFGAR